MSETSDNVKRKKTKTIKLAAILVTVVITVLVALIVFRALFPRVRETGYPPPDWCKVNLSGLVKALIIYANDHDDEFPSPDKWCDLLIGEDFAFYKQFVCPASDAVVGESSYAINKNVADKKISNLPADMVVLFETNFGKEPSGREGLLKEQQCYESVPYRNPGTKVYKLRWNQVGGPEILTTGNHKGKGCNVAFVDMPVEFVKTRKLGKLKWK
jgi:hypothetical protein